LLSFAKVSIAFIASGVAAFPIPNKFAEIAEAISPAPFPVF